MCEANQKQHASRQVRPIALISAEAKKLLYQKTFNSLNDIVHSINYILQLALSLGHLFCTFNSLNDIRQYFIAYFFVTCMATFFVPRLLKRWPSDKANCKIYAMNYCMSFKELKVF